MFDGDNCVIIALDFCLKLKGEEKKDEKNLEYNPRLNAHNGSGFDRWIALDNLPCDTRIVKIVKIPKGMVEIKLFNEYIRKKTENKFHNVFISDME